MAKKRENSAKQNLCTYKDISGWKLKPVKKREKQTQIESQTSGKFRNLEPLVFNPKSRLNWAKIMSNAEILMGVIQILFWKYFQNILWLGLMIAGSVGHRRVLVWGQPRQKKISETLFQKTTQV
jgi:hypothetical protein